MGDHHRNPLAFGTKIPPSGVKDRLGRDLDSGDLVLLNVQMPPTGLTWAVHQITPVLDPKLPPNMGVVILTATFRLQVPLTGQPVNELLRVAAASEIAPAPAADPETPGLIDS